MVCQVGIAQRAVAAALTAPDADADVSAAVAVWQRCATILDQLGGYPCVRPDGGWSLLIDTAAMGMTPAAEPGYEPADHYGDVITASSPPARPSPHGAWLRRRFPVIR